MLNTAYINLNLLRENALAVKSKLPKGVKFCAVVKANAYGHGLEVCANAIYDVVDSYAVALAEEGISLRLSGIDKEILVLIPPFSKDLDSAINYGLTLTVQSVCDMVKIEKKARELGRKVSVHVKYNTGMNRCGVDDLKTLKKMMEYSRKCQYLTVSGLFSHYAKPESNIRLSKATDKFLLAKEVVKGYNDNITCHISASGGLIKGKFFDMVRVGILLYGYTPFKTDAVSVKPIMKVYAPVVKKRALKPMDSALYNCKRTLTGKRLAIIRYGYADGLGRKKVRGQFNNRCMDLTAVNDSKRRLFPIMENADVLAKKYRTISYEILTKIAVRAEKKYIR